MIAVDTNILVRILVDDEGQPRQVAAARKVARRAKQVYVPQIVQAECVWVLESAYDFDKNNIVNALSHIYHNGAFELQRREIFYAGLQLYVNSSAGFADCLILAESMAQGSELCTFDKRLAKEAGVKLLEY